MSRERGSLESYSYVCNLFFPEKTHTITKFSYTGTSNTESKSLLIADCRPRVSAIANKGKGYGFEDASNYMNTTLEFLGIDNIHAIRGAYQRLQSAVQSHKPSDSLTWGKQVEDSNWLYYVRMVRRFSFFVFSGKHTHQNVRYFKEPFEWREL